MADNLPAVLREIHRLRRHLRDLQTEIDRGPRVLKAHQAKLAKQEQALAEAQEGLKRLKVQLHEQEVSLKTTHQQLAKFEKQLDDTANQKEYQAKQLEIQHARERSQQLEEAILARMSELDEHAARLPEVERQTQEARAEFATYEREAAERMERLKQQVQATEQELRAAEVHLPEKARDPYERLVKSHGADALAAVRDRICQHCRTSITLQQESDLEMGQFLTCKSCGRGLYPAG